MTKIVANSLWMSGRLALAISGSFVPQAAWAQGTPTTAAEADADADADADASKDILVYGRRSGYEQVDVDVGILGRLDFLETPFSVTTIPAVVIEAQNAVILTDVTKNDPAIQSQGGGSSTSLGIRGFGLSQESNYRQDGAITVNRSNYPFEAVERLEILRGLSSFLYGFAAPGGIVNIITKRPVEQGTSFKARALYAEKTNMLLSGDLSVREGPWGIRVNLAKEFGESYVNGLQKDRDVAAVAVRWQPSETLTFDADFLYQYDNNALFVPTILLDNDAVAIPEPIDPRVPLHARWETNDVTTTNYGVMARWDFTPGWSVKGSARRSYADRPVNGAILFVTNATFPGEYYRLLFRDDQESFAVNSYDAMISGSVKTGSISHSLTLGVEHYKNVNYFGLFDISFDDNGGAGFDLRQSYNSVEPDLPRSGGPGYKNFESTQTGIVFGDVIDFGERFTAILGGRYVTYQQKGFQPDGAVEGTYKTTAFTPSGAAVFKPTETMSIYASFAEGLEPGDTAPLDADNALDQLSAIRSTQFEIGVKFRSSNGRFTASGTVFRIERPSSFTDPVTNIFGEYGEQRHSGVEINLGGEVLRRLHVTGGLTYIDAKLTKADDPSLIGRRPANVAKFQGALFGEFEVVRNSFINAGVYHVGPRNYDVFTDRRADGYTRFDIGARWNGKLGGNNVSATATLENVGNVRYWEGVNQSLAIGLPRLFKLGLSTTF
jgi:iron complex outermembrane recepter protein